MKFFKFMDEFDKFCLSFDDILWEFQKKICRFFSRRRNDLLYIGYALLILALTPLAMFLMCKVYYYEYIFLVSLALYAVSTVLYPNFRGSMVHDRHCRWIIGIYHTALILITYACICYEPGDFIIR